MTIFKNKDISILASQKSDSSMFFAKDFEQANKVIKVNRRNFFNKYQINPDRLVNLWGIHGTDIFRVKEKDLGKGALNPKTKIENTDGLASNIKNSYLMITGADCFPVFFYDSKNKTIGIAHAGWRGVIKGIIPKMISKLKKDFNSKPQNIKVWLGPGIGKCHFEVKKDVVKLFDKYRQCIIKKGKKFYIDLPLIIKQQLIESGIKISNFKNRSECTYCENEKWYSFRKDTFKPLRAGAFIIHLK